MRHQMETTFILPKTIPAYSPLSLVVERIRRPAKELINSYPGACLIIRAAFSKI